MDEGSGSDRDRLLTEARLRVAAARANVLAVAGDRLPADALEPVADLLARAGLFLRAAT